MNLEVELKLKLELAISMLKPCACPMCDGSGTVPILVTRSATGWEDDGFGNAIAVEVPVEDWDLEQCEWCYTKEKLINENDNPK